MLNRVFLLSCLLLSLVSSAPWSSNSDSWSASSSSSDEDLQSPAVAEAPPSVIMKVANTKTNITLSFAIFIVAEEEEGSGANAGRRSDDNSTSSESDDISSEETTAQPMGSLLPAETEPMTEENRDQEGRLSSEEMMSDQPAFSEWSDLKGTSVTDELKPLSAELKRGTGSRMLNDPGYEETFDYYEDTNNEETTDATLSLSAGLSNITGSREVHSRPTVSDDNSTESQEYGATFGDSKTGSDQPTPGLTLDFSNSSSSEVSELNSNPDSQSSGGDQQGASSSSEEASSVSQNVVGSSPQDVVGSSLQDVVGSSPQDVVGSSLQNVVGSSLQNVFRSIQDIVDLVSGNKRPAGAKGRNQEGLGSTSFVGSQVGFSLSSDESDESSESDPKNQTSISSGPDSDGGLEGTRSSTQKGPDPRDSTEQVTGPTTDSVSAVMNPGPDSKEVPDSAAGSTGADKGGSWNRAYPDQGVAPLIRTMLKDTVSQQNTRSFSQLNISLNPSSSEESPESVGTQDAAGSGPDPQGAGPELRSSSEEVSSPSSPVISLQTPTVPESLSSEPEEPDSSRPGPGSQGVSRSWSTDSSPTSKSGSDPESNFRSVSQEESEESPTIKVPTDSNSASREANLTAGYIANSAEGSMDANSASSVKDAHADLSAEATTDSRYDVSIDADPTIASAHVSTNKDTSSELSIEDANTEATADSVSIKPTANVEHSTDFSDSRANTDVIANVEKARVGAEVSTGANTDANRLDSNQHANSKENMAAPPRRKRPYHFGFLGPIINFYRNQPIARETLAVQHNHRQQPIRKQTRISVAMAANAAKSSSEETN